MKEKVGEVFSIAKDKENLAEYKRKQGIHSRSRGRSTYGCC